MVVTVPAGFLSDFASIPAFAALFGFDDDDFCEAAVLHDYLYTVKTCTRAAADREFLLALKATKCSAAKRWTIYRMVRLFGWHAWNRKGE